MLWQIDQASSRLFQTSGKIGQELRENEWLMSIKQRTSIPGGVCEFDLPSYHYWLQQSAGAAPPRPAAVARAVPADPRRHRDRAAAAARVRQDHRAGRLPGRLPADDGRAHRADAAHPARSASTTCVPEISANKYALNIRFTTQEGRQRPRPETDVEFELTFCNL